MRSQADEEDELVAELARVLEKEAPEGPEDDEEAPSPEVLRRLTASLATPAAAEATSPPANRRTRPTPYEVWAASRTSTTMPTHKPKAGQKDWKAAVDRLYASHKHREQTVAAAQTRHLAEELRQTRFEPRKGSRRGPSMVETQDAARARFEASMRRARRLAAAAEIAGCTFTPDLPSKARSAAYLRRSRHPDRQTDALACGEEANARRCDVTLRDHDLTFAPSLNRRSLQMTAAVERDPVSRQTIAKPKTRSAAKARDSFRPKISKRAMSYAHKRPETDVYDRLYAMAKDHVAEQHNTQVAFLEAYVRAPRHALKAWETTVVDHPPGERRAPWIPQPRRSAPHPASHTFATLEYSNDFDKLLDLVKAPRVSLDPPPPPPPRGRGARTRPPPPPPRDDGLRKRPPPPGGTPNLHLAAAMAVLDDEDP